MFNIKFIKNSSCVCITGAVFLLRNENVLKNAGFANNKVIITDVLIAIYVFSKMLHIARFGWS